MSSMYKNPIKMFVIGIRLLNIQIIFFDDYVCVIFYSMYIFIVWQPL